MDTGLSGYGEPVAWGKVVPVVSAFAAASWPTDTSCDRSAMPRATAKNFSFISVRLLFSRRESSQTIATH